MSKSKDTELVDTNQPQRKYYKVIAKSGIFKNGKLYKKGSKAFLDVNTAANFIAMGDIEEL